MLTGTPLENKLEELISIVQFVDQHRLGPTWKLLHEHQVKDEIGRVTGYTGLEKVGQTMAPILIRRRRAEVLTQLPSRTDQNLLVPMTEMQLVHHQANADIVRLAQLYGTTRPSLIRTLIGAEHHEHGAMFFRTLACLPVLTGAWRDRGGGLARGDRGLRGGEPRAPPGVAEAPRAAGRAHRRARGGLALDASRDGGRGQPRARIGRCALQASPPCA